MHVPLILLQFHLGIFRLFRFATNRKFRENVGTAIAEAIKTVYMYVKIFSLFVCNSVTDLLQFHETSQDYETGCAISSNFAAS